MTKEEMLTKLQNNEQIKKFQKFMSSDNLKYSAVRLVGGAVIDILEDRIPKDYDFTTGVSMEGLVGAGWKFLYSSSTADTYDFNGIICQVLKKPVEDFEFTISQSEIRIKSDRIDALGIDLTSFNNKILIPNGWTRKHVKDCLLRIPHYRRKGYSISDETYLSLVRVGMRTEGGKIDS